MSEFLAMGGYGAYVWSSYAIFMLFLLFDFIAPRLRNRRVIAELRGRLKRDRKRQEKSP
ncbi:heme exporter protein CcmD [Dokdonella immobilis]|uniref:Heme exporter protein D n=1 Tax=Dokdonella immobilis TaxID=578942 RepID=A0A1I4V3J4_9GAMM|nr:heme exporter protein CcmD [Dokdonella immobilis]SFM95701.1 heme exporter protein D [Dokdonella immobilis]